MDVPHIILQIHPSRKMKAVMNCKSATQEFFLRTEFLLAPFGRTLAPQQKGVIPDKSVPEKNKGISKPLLATFTQANQCGRNY